MVTIDHQSNFRDPLSVECWTTAQVMSTKSWPCCPGVLPKWKWSVDARQWPLLWHALVYSKQLAEQGDKPFLRASQHTQLKVSHRPSSLPFLRRIYGAHSMWGPGKTQFQLWTAHSLVREIVLQAKLNSSVTPSKGGVLVSQSCQLFASPWAA